MTLAVCKTAVAAVPAAESIQWTESERGGGDSERRKGGVRDAVCTKARFRLRPKSQQAIVSPSSFRTRTLTSLSRVYGWWATMAHYARFLFPCAWSVAATEMKLNVSFVNWVEIRIWSGAHFIVTVDVHLAYATILHPIPSHSHGWSGKERKLLMNIMFAILALAVQCSFAIRFSQTERDYWKS